MIPVLKGFNIIKFIPSWFYRDPPYHRSCFFLPFHCPPIIKWILQEVKSFCNFFISNSLKKIWSTKNWSIQHTKGISIVQARKDGPTATHDRSYLKPIPRIFRATKPYIVAIASVTKDAGSRDYFSFVTHISWLVLYSGYLWQLKNEVLFAGVLVGYLKANQSYVQDIHHTCSRVHMVSIALMCIDFAFLQLFLIPYNSFLINSLCAPLFSHDGLTFDLLYAQSLLRLTNYNMAIFIRVLLLLVNTFFVGSALILNFLIPLSLTFLSSLFALVS